MMARLFAALSVLACGCGLVSGLDSLVVVDGAAPSDASVLDAPDANDANDALDETVVDANDDTREASVNTALDLAGGCATATSTISLTNSAFSVELWLDLTSVQTNTAASIVWNGGRNVNEPGWSIDVVPAGVELCVASSTGSKCTTPAGIPENHLVHVVVTSSIGVAASTRTLSLYALDQTASETTHTLLSSATAAPNTWASTSPFTVGGAFAQTCSGTIQGVIDRLRIFSVVLSVADMNASMSTDACSAPNVLYDFEFDEGSGTTTTSCVGATSLTLVSSASFVPSPFP